MNLLYLKMLNVNVPFPRSAGLVSTQIFILRESKCAAT